MGEPNYPEKHKPEDCNDGQCKLCEEPEDHDCHLSPDDGCQVCLDAVEREQEARAKEERKHGTA